MTSRDVYRLSYAAMVLALTVACTPAADETAAAPPAAEPPAITATTEQITAPPPAAASTAPAATPEELASGRSAYARTCSMCHGAKGEGTPAAAAIASRDVAVIADKITRGAINPGDRMPPMAAMMSGDELDDVAKFVAAGLPAE